MLNVQFRRNWRNFYILYLIKIFTYAFKFHCYILTMNGIGLR